MSDEEQPSELELKLIEITEDEFRKNVIQTIDMLNDQVDKLNSIYATQLKKFEKALIEKYRILRDMQLDKGANNLKFYYEENSNSVMYVPKTKDKIGFKSEE